jgi:DNA-binding transcriptional LysR family regulator
VSKTIAGLEDVLGVRLFDRSSQGVEPTPYGRALLRRSIAVFDDLRTGVDEIKFLADPTAGELRIGSTEPLLAGLGVAVMERLWRRHPRINFRVVEAGAEAARAATRLRKAAAGRGPGGAPRAPGPPLPSLSDHRARGGPKPTARSPPATGTGTVPPPRPSYGVDPPHTSRQNQQDNISRMRPSHQLGCSRARPACPQRHAC